MKHVKEQAKAHAARRIARVSGGHSDVAADKAMVRSMVKPAALRRADGGGVNETTAADRAAMMAMSAANAGSSSSSSTSTSKARGGSVKGKSKPKGKTQVNVLVGSPHPAGGAAMPSAPMGGVGMAAPGLPTGLRKHGGHVKRANGGQVKHVIDDGAGSGPGRLEKREAYGKRAKVH